MSDHNFERRRAIRFCFRLGRRKLFAPLSRARVFRRFKTYSESRLKMNLAVEGLQLRNTTETSVDGQKNDRRTVGIDSHHRSSDFDRRSGDEGKSARKRFRKIRRNIGRTTEGTGVSMFWEQIENAPSSSERVVNGDEWNSPQRTTFFRTLEKIQTSATVRPKTIPVSEFHIRYEQRERRLRRCADSQGDCLTGDIVK